MEEKILDTSIIHFNLNNGILFATYKTGKVDLAVAKEVVRLRKEFCENKSYPHLVKDYNVSQVNKEARDFLSSDEAIEGVLAAGLITDSAFKMSLMNFFLKVSKPKVKAKTFTKENEALEWLNQFKN